MCWNGEDRNMVYNELRLEACRAQRSLCKTCRDEVDRIGAPHSSEIFGLLDTEQPIRVGTNVGPKAHVLVCAPSNSALDEIVARLLQHGVLDWCAEDLPSLPHACPGAQEDPQF